MGHHFNDIDQIFNDMMDFDKKDPVQVLNNAAKKAMEENDKPKKGVPNRDIKKDIEGRYYYEAECYSKNGIFDGDAGKPADISDDDQYKSAEDIFLIREAAYLFDGIYAFFQSIGRIFILIGKLVLWPIGRMRRVIKATESESKYKMWHFVVALLIVNSIVLFNILIKNFTIVVTNQNQFIMQYEYDGEQYTHVLIK